MTAPLCLDGTFPDVISLLVTGDHLSFGHLLFLTGVVVARFRAALVNENADTQNDDLIGETRIK